MRVGKSRRRSCRKLFKTIAQFAPSTGEEEILSPLDLATASLGGAPFDEDSRVVVAGDCRLFRDGLKKAAGNGNG